MTSRGVHMQLMGPMCWPSDERDIDPAPSPTHRSKGWGLPQEIRPHGNGNSGCGDTQPRALLRAHLSSAVTKEVSPSHGSCGNPKMFSLPYWGGCPPFVEP